MSAGEKAVGWFMEIEENKRGCKYHKMQRALSSIYRRNAIDAEIMIQY